jgi:hypothetical protein
MGQRTGAGRGISTGNHRRPLLGLIAAVIIATAPLCIWMIIRALTTTAEGETIVAQREQNGNA